MNTNYCLNGGAPQPGYPTRYAMHYPWNTVSASHDIRRVLEAAADHFVRISQR